MGKTGVEMMMGAFGMDADSITEKLKSFVEDNPMIEKVKNDVRLFAITTHERITAIEESQKSIHAKLDLLIENRVIPKIESYSHIIPAGDDGLHEMMLEQTPSTLQLVNGEEKL